MRAVGDRVGDHGVRGEQSVQVCYYAVRVLVMVLVVVVIVVVLVVVVVGAVSAVVVGAVAVGPAGAACCCRFFVDARTPSYVCRGGLGLGCDFHGSFVCVCVFVLCAERFLANNVPSMAYKG